MAQTAIAEIAAAILAALPTDGAAVGNAKLKETVATRLGVAVDEAEYRAARATLIRDGVVATGKGRGGSVRRSTASAGSESEPLTLEAQAVPESAKRPKPQQSGLALQTRKTGEPTKSVRKSNEDAKLIAYRHDQKRRNNPDVGVVTPETDPEQPKTTWAFDPHLDPALKFDVTRAGIENLIDDALASGDEAEMRTALETLRRMAAPYLDWTGKAERTSFEIDTVSLHVHERIDPATILAALRKRMSAPPTGAKASAASHPSPNGRGAGGEGPISPAQQTDFFRAWFEDPLPYREAIEFYKHDRGWANRLVAGDSLLVMNSLLQKEGMAGQVQMIYIDPPYIAKTTSFPSGLRLVPNSMIDMELLRHDVFRGENQ